MEEWIKKSDVLEMLSLPLDVLTEHIYELKGIWLDKEETINKDAVCFRYKKSDGTMVYCHVLESKLWEEESSFEHCVYLDMDDDTLKKIIDTLNSMPTYGDR